MIEPLTYGIPPTSCYSYADFDKGAAKKFVFDPHGDLAKLAA